MSATPGGTNYIAYFYITEDVGGTNPGEPKTGMLFSDLTSASYMRQGGARVAITPITLASASATHADGGFVEVDATNMKGLYRLDLPDAAIAAGVDLVIAAILPAGAQNAVASPLEIELTGQQTGDSFARLGAPAGASVSADIADLPTVAEFNARTILSANYATAANLAIVDGIVDDILVDTGTTIPATIDDLPTVAEFNARTILAASYATAAALAIVDGIVDDILVDTGTSLPAGIAANLVEIEINQSGIAANLAAIADVPTTAEFEARTVLSAVYATAAALAIVDGIVDDILVDTGTTIPAQITALENLSFDDIWTGTLTESYAANGSTLTPAQAFHMIWSDLRSPQQVGTTWTDFRLNNTTSAMTFLLDDATTPTKKTRAT